MEQMGCLEPLTVIRNQQVAGSILAGGSNKIKHLTDKRRGHGWYFGRYFIRLWAGGWTFRH